MSWFSLCGVHWCVIAVFSRGNLLFGESQGVPAVPSPSPKYFLFDTLANRLRETAVSSVMSVRPSVRMEQNDCHRTNFREMSYLICKPKCLDGKITDVSRNKTLLCAVLVLPMSTLISLGQTLRRKLNRLPT